MAATKSETTIFGGCIIAVGFASEFTHTREEIVDIINENGGLAVNNVNERVTHVCCSSEDPFKAQAKALKLPVLEDTLLFRKKELGQLLPVNFVGTGTKRRASETDKSAGADDRDALTKRPRGPEPAKMKGRAEVDNKTMSYNTHVYERGDEIFTASLNQTNIDNNNNKFYIIQLLESDNDKKFWVWNRWGRVGATGQNKLLPGPSGFTNVEDAIVVFKKKFREKTGHAWESRFTAKSKPGHYTIIEIDYSGDAEAIIDKVKRQRAVALQQGIPDSALVKPVQDFVQEIYNLDNMQRSLVEMEFDIEQMPLGKLKRATILQAYEHLKKIDTLLDKPEIDHTKLKHHSNCFYSLIPHNFGRSQAPAIKTKTLLKAKLQMLEALGDIEIATDILNRTVDVSVNPIDQHYEALRANIEPLPQDTEEFAVLRDYVARTHGATHEWYTLDILDVFKVDRNGESDRFEAKSSSIPNHMLLWHGSRLTNFVGILSQGLRIAPPEAPVTGYMFGKGVYFADSVSKSANYCGATHERPVAYIILADVAVGKPYELQKAEYMERAPKGFHSTVGLGKNTPDPAVTTTLNGSLVPYGSMIDSPYQRSDLLYNEYIVYDVAQVRMRYVIKLKFNFIDQD